MSDRVLAGSEAVEQGNRMRQIIEDGLAAQLIDLETTAQRLSDPNVWDGPHAEQFRGNWEEMGPRLRAAQADLVELRNWANAVTGSILTAGGNRF